MTLVDSLAANASRSAVYRAYLEGRVHAERLASDMSAHWWGLCDALSSHSLSRDTLLPGPALWAELVPFLLIPSEERAVMVLAEYGVFKAHAPAADIELLGLEINPALHRLDITDGRVVSYLDDAMAVYRPAWLALLSYETFGWVQRTLAAARLVPGDPRLGWCGRVGPLWLKRGPGEVESEALGSLED